MTKWFSTAAAAALLMCGCAVQTPAPATDAAPGGDIPIEAATGAGGITLGDPVALVMGSNNNLLVADGSMGRVVRINIDADEAIEFDQPSQSPSFYPADIAVSGFFLYALDVAARGLLRFDRNGAYRDVLISFDTLLEGRRSTPTGLDVDDSGRIVITDAANHGVVFFNNYLQVDLVFGNYGTAPGQFNAPEGVTFVAEGGIVVADTGNRRLQIFDSGGKHLQTVPAVGSGGMMRPRRVVVDASGKFYVADPDAGCVFVFDAGGERLRRIFPEGVSRFRPMDVALASDGTIYVADSGSATLYAFR